MTTATSYVRKATAAGALLAGPNSPFVRAEVNRLEWIHATGQLTSCEHLEGRLELQVALWPTFGEQTGQLLCLDCWADPGPAAGCQACDRRPVPGVRRIVSLPMPGTAQVVALAQACRLDRRRLA